MPLPCCFGTSMITKGNAAHLQRLDEWWLFRPLKAYFVCSLNARTRRSSLLRRSRKVASIGGGRTATYKNGIVSRLDNPLNLDVVERKFSEA